MLKILAALLALVGPASAQSVQQSGSITPGHVPMWTTNGVIQDGGPAVAGFLSGIGVTAQGPSICANSGPTTGPYNSLCLSVNASSPAQLILQNFGGAPAETIQCVINGTISSCFGGTLAGGSLGQLQYNRDGTTFGGITGVTSDGTNLTVSGTLNVSGVFQSSAHTITFPSVAATMASLNVADQTVTGGANTTALSLATGPVTIDCGARPLQFISNNAAFTITAPAADGSCIVLVTNTASAGAITFSGFNVGTNTGDALDTINGDKFSLNIWRINGTAGYRVAAHQ